MPAEIQYPSESVERSIQQNLLGEGFAVGVEFPSFKGPLAPTYQSYDNYTPLVKLIEETQYFMDRVSERHCLDEFEWTKQSGVDTRYRYVPATCSGYQLAGYPLYDHDFWANFKENIVDLGSGLNRVGCRDNRTGFNTFFDPWITNRGGKVQWSGAYYNPKYPHNTIAASSTPHPLEFLRYGKPNRADFYQYVPNGQAYYLSLTSIGSILETKSVAVERELPHTNEERVIDYDLVRSGYYAPVYKEFLNDALIDQYGDGWSVRDFMKFYPPIDIHLRKMHVSGTVNLSDCVNFLFTDGGAVPADTTDSAWTISFDNSPSNGVSNAFNLDCEFVKSYPDTTRYQSIFCPPVNYHWPKFSGLDNPVLGGKPVISLDFSKRVNIAVYSLMKSGIKESGISNQTLKNRTGIEYSGFRGFYCFNESPSYSTPTMECRTPLSQVKMFSTPILNNWGWFNYTPCNGLDVLYENDPNFGDGNFYCDGTIHPENIIEPSGKLIFAYSMESSVSGILETWRDRSYRTIYEVDFDEYSLRPYDYPIDLECFSSTDPIVGNSPYKITGSGMCFTQDKGQYPHQSGWGIHNVMKSGYTNFINSLEEEMSCGANTDEKMLVFYTFKDPYLPNSPKWTSDIRYYNWLDASGVGTGIWDGVAPNNFYYSGTYNVKYRNFLTESHRLEGGIAAQPTDPVSKSGYGFYYQEYKDVPHYPTTSIAFYDDPFKLGIGNGLPGYRAIDHTVPEISGKSIIRGPFTMEIGGPTLIYPEVIHQNAAPHYLRPYYDFN